MMSSTSRTSSSAMLADRSLMIRTRPDDSVAVPPYELTSMRSIRSGSADLAHQVRHERQRALEHGHERERCGRRSRRRSGGRAPPTGCAMASSVSRISPMSACRSADAGHERGRRCLQVAARSGSGVDDRRSGTRLHATAPSRAAGSSATWPATVPRRRGLRRRRPGVGAGRGDVRAGSSGQRPSAGSPVVGIGQRSRRDGRRRIASAPSRRPRREQRPRRPRGRSGRPVRGGVACPVVPDRSSSSASRPNLSSSARKSRA